MLDERLKTLSCWRSVATIASIAFILAACTDYDDVFEDNFGYGQSSKGSKLDSIAMTLKDYRDNHVYNVAWVGSLYWMMDNLSYEYYSSGKDYYLITACPTETVNGKGDCESTGFLYPGQRLEHACPSGWRLPSLEEWREFYNSPEFQSQSESLPYKGYISGDHSWNQNGETAFYWASEYHTGGYRNCINFTSESNSFESASLCHEQWKMAVRCVKEAGSEIPTIGDERLKINVYVKPTAYQNQTNCTVAKGWQNCSDFFIKVENNSAIDLPVVQLRFYLGAYDGLETPVSWISSSFDANGKAASFPQISFGDQTKDGLGRYYLPINIQGTLYSGGYVIFQVKWLNATFAAFDRKAWSLMPQTDVYALEYFEGIDLTQAPYFTGSESYEIEKNSSGEEVNAYTLDPYIPVYYRSKKISGYAPGDKK